MLTRGTFALELQLFLSAEAQVRLSLIQQAVGMLAINGEALGLAIGTEGAAHVRAFVPVETQPLQIGDQLIFEAGFAAVDVRVFDAEHHGPTLLAREKPIEESGAGVADVKVAGRGWSEADADGLGHEEMLAGVCRGGQDAFATGWEGGARRLRAFRALTLFYVSLEVRPMVPGGS